MSDYPKQVHIAEEGPREGFQAESADISTDDKVRLIEALADCRVPEINCASFVNPKVVPQMADVMDIAERIRRRADVTYGCMWLNARGFEQAMHSGLSLHAVTSGSASDTFLKRNNNRTPEDQLEGQCALRTLYSEHGLGSGPVYLFTAFGCNYEGLMPVEKAMGRAEELVGLCEDAGVPPTAIYLCDTVGAATPEAVRRLVCATRERWPDYEIGLHLHDTRGVGIANALVGLELGVARFDASVGGLGGCPFAGNSAVAGNIATEELVLLCESLGIETGIDLDGLIAAAELAESIVGHPLPSKLYRAGRFFGTQ